MAQAREWYLKAGLAHDKGLAASAHFNLGTLAAEEARRLAGEHPENVAPDKRQEILDQLKAAVASFRHCLELQPDNPSARRDIELVRQWIKYYTDQWQAHDREKRRQETNLVAFLEFLIETQRALRESVKAAPRRRPRPTPLPSRNACRKSSGGDCSAQGEDQDRADTPASPRGDQPRKPTRASWSKESRCSKAGPARPAKRCHPPRRHLDGRQAGPAAADQQAAIDELEKIWDAVIPFHPLLARDLADQTEIARSLAPPPAADSKSGADDAFRQRRAGSKASQACIEKSQCPPRVVRHSGPNEKIWPRSLNLRSERSAGRNCSSSRPRPSWHDWRSPARPSPAEGARPLLGSERPADWQGNRTKPVDPKQIKAGYQKAIDLAPRAVEQMERVVKSLKQNDAQAAYPPAEEARKILEEIQKAQPRKDQQNPRAGSEAAGSEARKTRTSRSKISRINRSKISRRNRTSGKMRLRSRRTISRSRIRNRRNRKSPRNRTSRNRTNRETATGLARSDRRGAAQGPRTAAGKARTRPQDEGPSCSAESPWRRTGDATRAVCAMTGLASAILVLLAAQAVPTMNRKSSSKRAPARSSSAKASTTSVEIRNVKSPSPPDLSAATPGLRRRLRGRRVAQSIVHVHHQWPGHASRTASATPTVTD